MRNCSSDTMPRTPQRMTAAWLALGTLALLVACGSSENVSTTTTERVTTQQPAAVYAPPATVTTTTRTQRTQ